MPESQDPLFPEFDRKSRAEAERRRKEAMERVDKHADPVKKRAWEAALYYVSVNREEFTTDAVDSIYKSWGYRDASEKRFTGSIIQTCARANWIAPTGRYEKSIEPGCHERPKAVWRSLLFRRRAA